MLWSARSAYDKVKCAHDIGNHRAYFKTFIDYALADLEYGDEMRSYMKERLNSQD